MLLVFVIGCIERNSESSILSYSLGHFCPCKVVSSSAARYEGEFLSQVSCMKGI
jgi:hypothetical protein